ncbi:MAG TPA: Uma2 family endonuclease [Aggregatilineales bacterium]|nr:Uma2 family endonuclease [Aggregatilineales bacterium]
MTVEKFWEQYAGKPYELVEGMVVKVAPAIDLHGIVAGNAFGFLWVFNREHHLGTVYAAETGFQLGPNTMRAPDVGFVRKERLNQIYNKFVPLAPDLAVEVVSPGDTASEVQKKVDIYLAAGTELVWVMYPDLKEVIVHRTGGESKRVLSDGVLDGGEMLPGLKIPVAELFPPEHE